MGGAGRRRFRIPGWIKTLKVKAQECSGLEDVRKAEGMVPNRGRLTESVETL
jgi:hypothetical protein